MRQGGQESIECLWNDNKDKRENLEKNPENSNFVHKYHSTDTRFELGTACNVSR